MEMRKKWRESVLHVRGKAAGGPRPSHLNHGTAYFSFPLEVERLSGATDTLNVILSQQTLEACPIIPGETYEAIGEVRSFNNHRPRRLPAPPPRHSPACGRPGSGAGL